jgi:hypothetical protein
MFRHLKPRHARGFLISVCLRAPNPGGRAVSFLLGVFVIFFGGKESLKKRVTFLEELRCDAPSMNRNRLFCDGHHIGRSRSLACCSS